MADDRPFRERAKELFEAAFGPPQVLPTESRPLYRWVLRRKTGLNAHVYITIDSPELPDLAHVLISDPGSGAVEPLSALTLRTIPEVHALIERLRSQVREPNADAPPPES